MRTLDAALTAKQQAATRQPYVRIYFDNRAGTTYTYTTFDATDRVLFVNQWEEPYAGVATIRLSNYDGHFTGLDLRGYSVSIGWGYILDSTPGSTWYSNAAVMKVRIQRDISVEGELVTEFICLSVWAEIVTSTVMAAGKKLTGTEANPGAKFVLGELVTGAPSGATGRVAIVGHGYIVVVRITGTFATGDTVSGASASLTSIAAPTDNYGPLMYIAGDTAISARIAALLSGIVTGVTVDTDDPAGTMASTPAFAMAVGTDIRSVIRQMLLRSKCGMRYGNDGYMHVLYLNTATAAQYSFDSSHAFFTDLREQAIILPNTVVFVDALPATDGTVATYIGTANDATSVAKIGTFTIIQVDAGLVSNADAQAKAEAWIAQMVAEAYQGLITAPMECGLEVYDMLQAVDGRLAVTAKGRAGRVEREFNPTTDTYEIRLQLGSLYSEPGAMDVMPESRETDLVGLVSTLETMPPSRAEVAAYEVPRRGRVGVGANGYASVAFDPPFSAIPVVVAIVQQDGHFACITSLSVSSVTFRVYTILALTTSSAGSHYHTVAAHSHGPGTLEANVSGTVVAVTPGGEEHTGFTGYSSPADPHRHIIAAGGSVNASSPSHAHTLGYGTTGNASPTTDTQADHTHTLSALLASPGVVVGWIAIAA